MRKLAFLVPVLAFFLFSSSASAAITLYEQPLSGSLLEGYLDADPLVPGSDSREVVLTADASGSPSSVTFDIQSTDFDTLPAEGWTVAISDYEFNCVGSGIGSELPVSGAWTVEVSGDCVLTEGEPFALTLSVGNETDVFINLNGSAGNPEWDTLALIVEGEAITTPAGVLASSSLSYDDLSTVPQAIFQFVVYAAVPLFVILLILRGLIYRRIP